MSAWSKNQNSTQIGKWIINITAGMLIVGLGFLILLNVQPWIDIAHLGVQQINTIPMIDFLIDLPLIGGWIELIGTNLAALLGCVLWICVNGIEVAPWFAPDTELKKFRMYAFGVDGVVNFLRFPPYFGGIEEFINDFWNWDTDLIDYGMIVWFIIGLFGFECGVYVILKTLRARRWN